MPICAQHFADEVALSSPITPARDRSEHSGITVGWASSDDDLRAVQRLRYDVFVVEMGAVPCDEDVEDCERLERDRFDPFCDHLLVRAPASAAQPRGAVIGTYRVLRPKQARRAGGFYCETEFDLRPLDILREKTVELGRSCVHPDWRSGAVMMAMWRALGEYMHSYQLDTMIGCASIWVGDNGAMASAIWEHLRHAYLVDERWQIRPRDATILPAIDASRRNIVVPPSSIPPLIKGYLRCGARLLGPPAFDRAFNTADLPMMMQFSDITSRYRKHFLERRVHQ